MKQYIKIRYERDERKYDEVKQRTGVEEKY